MVLALGPVFGFGFGLGLAPAPSPVRAEAPGPSARARGDRTLSVKVNLGEEGDFDRAFLEALEVGSETQIIPQDWNELETAPGQFEPATDFLAIANGYYRARTTPVHLSLRPVHTNRKVVPADLMDRPMDDPEVIRRFGRLLDWVASKVPDLEVTTLVIGSEVDVHAWGDSAKWEAWTRFYAASAAHARKAFPGTRIACETTHAALLGPDLERARRLHRHGDVVGVSYYPMARGLEAVRPPGSIHADLDAIVAAIPARPVVFYQIGYPSSPELGSSPARQAAFVEEAFRAWDRHAGRVPMMAFQWMHEAPGPGLDHFAGYYGNHTPAFRAFLGSLGLRSWSGRPKPAWEVLGREARKRGFGRPRSGDGGPGQGPGAGLP